VSAPAEHADLGAALKRLEHPSRRVPKLAGGVVALLVAAVVSFTLIGEEGDGRDVPTYLTGLFVVGALYLLWFTIRVPRHTAVVHEHGLALRGGAATHRVRWDQVRSVVANLKEARFGLTGSVTHRYTITLDDGDSITLHNAYPRIEELGRIVEQETARHLVPAAAAALERGETVTFGPATISLESLTVGRRSAPLEQVAELRMDRGRVYLIGVHGGSFKAGAGVPAKLIPNVRVLFVLYDWVRHGGGRGGGTTDATTDDEIAALPGHFGAIGVAFRAHADALLQRSDARLTLDFPGGRTFTWHDVSGAAVCFVAEEQPDGTSVLVCSTPFLLGGGSMPVRVDGFSEDAECRHCTYAHVSVLDEHEEERTKLVFQLGPRASAEDPMPVPGGLAEAQITAVVEHVARFPSEADYYAAQTDDRPLAVRSFIPTGLFQDPPGPLGLLTGIVRTVEHRTNTATGQPFTVVELDGYPGSWLVALRAADVPPELTAGEVLRADCWLVGRLLPAAVGASAPDGASLTETPGTGGMEV
jgi:hypothetical protein